MSNDSASRNTASGCGCTGCLAVFVYVLVIWAFMFGVTVDGRHYEMSCGDGIEVHEVAP